MITGQGFAVDSEDDALTRPTGIRKAHGHHARLNGFFSVRKEVPTETPLLNLSVSLSGAADHDLREAFFAVHLELEGDETEVLDVEDCRLDFVPRRTADDRYGLVSHVASPFSQWFPIGART